MSSTAASLHKYRWQFHSPLSCFSWSQWVQRSDVKNAHLPHGIHSQARGASPGPLWTSVKGFTWEKDLCSLQMSFAQLAAGRDNSSTFFTPVFGVGNCGVWGADPRSQLFTKEQLRPQPWMGFLTLPCTSWLWRRSANPSMWPHYKPVWGTEFFFQTQWK